MLYDLIIIGGGPAAFSAAIYGARKKLNFKVLAQKIGGEQLSATGKIENYPGIKSIGTGLEFIQKLQEHVKEYNVEIEQGQEVVGIEPSFAKILDGKAEKKFLVKTKKGSKYEAKTVIVASGKRPRKLGVPGEKEFEAKGVSYCSICDAPLFLDKTVAVVGGGNAGLDSAMDLTKYAKKIYILEFGPRVIGDNATKEKLKATRKVEFITMAQTKEIKGDITIKSSKVKFVTGLCYEDRNTKEEKELEVQGVFINIGSVTSAEFVKGFLELNSVGEIITDHKTCQTSVEGIFAAGDVTDIPFKQIIIAVGEGAKAALSAYKYLQHFD